MLILTEEVFQRIWEETENLIRLCQVKNEEVILSWKKTKSPSPEVEKALLQINDKFLHFINMIFSRADDEFTTILKDAEIRLGEMLKITGTSESVIRAVEAQLEQQMVEYFKFKKQMFESHYQDKMRTIALLLNTRQRVPLQ